MDPSTWDRDACAQWVEDLGFPQYKEAFRANLNGRRIMALSIKGLTRMGIRYHEDQKVIMEAFRAVLADVEAAKKREEDEAAAKAEAQANLDGGVFDDPF